MVKPHDVQQFCEEMTRKNADWQMHIFSQTQHAFMNPLANDPQLGTCFQPRSAIRAYDLMTTFLNEKLATAMTT
jgi:dienelactone hydrolase